MKFRVNIVRHIRYTYEVVADSSLFAEELVYDMSPSEAVSEEEISYSVDSVEEIENSSTPTYRVCVEEHDRWSGPDKFYMTFDTLEKAKAYKKNQLKEEHDDYVQNKGIAPEYYTKVKEIQEILTVNGRIFVGDNVG